MIRFPHAEGTPSRSSGPAPRDSEQSRAARQSARPAPVAALLLSLLLSGGCALLEPRPTPATPPSQTDAAPARPAATPTPDPAADTAPAPRDLWQRMRAGFRLDDGAPHPRIEREIERLRRHPHALRALLDRAAPWLPGIVAGVEARGLPMELALLPAVESGFVPHAYSPSAAAGLWQIMPGTARMLGLRMDRWYDARRDPVASTEAALRYLDTLHRRLDGDWLHALAAYNSGIGRVRKAIRRARAAGRSDDYWSLELPAETDAYVPRLLALARVVADPGAHGLTLPPAPRDPELVPVRVPDALDLEVAATLAGLPLDTLLRFNPAFPRGMTPPGRVSTLLLPAAHRQRFERALAALPRRQWRRWAEHRVAPGDSLIRIARRHRVSVAAIRRANGLKGNLIRAGQTLRIPLAGRAADARRGIAARQRPRIRYRVRKGDSLYTIARRFQVSVRDLRRWNGVGRHIRPGQRLTVYPGS